MTESLEDRLRRLERERDEADRLYNGALTELDRALPGITLRPEPVLPLDEQQLATLNEAWNILPAPPAAGGLQQKLAGFIWKTIGPYLQRQLTFNSVLVDHINRNVAAQKEAHRRSVEAAAALRAHLDTLSTFHARLMIYLQQITAYVDTRDRHAGGGALVLNAAISDMAEAQAKYRESLASREYRYEARTSALSAAHDELRSMVGVTQQALVAVKRAVHGSEVPRFHGSEGPGFQGSEVPGFQGSEVPGFRGSEVPGLQGSEALGAEDSSAVNPQISGIPEPQNAETMERRDHGPPDPRNLGTPEPRNLGTLEPRNLGTSEPRTPEP